MKRPLRTVLKVVLMWGAVLSGCAVQDRVIDPGTRIHHDDFEYSVRDIDRTDRIGDKQAGGTFLVVTFQVENRAGRVNHRWSNDIAYIVDGTGRQYESDGAAQRALEAVKPFGYKDRYVTPAEAVETTRLVFDLPKDVKEPYLKVRGEFLMGDLFDANQYQRTRVKLF
jgi:Domain of unknown function (DUF4352)